MARIAAGLAVEPPLALVAGLVVVFAAGLYGGGLDYPLVFGDFAVLAAGRLDAYASAVPVLGADWLADASFGWSARLFGAEWAWHRMLNLALHAAAVMAAFALFRRIAAPAPAAGSQAIAAGWIAFLAAALFALHPAAVYGVAYLAQRASVLAGFCALIALWSTARGVQDAWRGAWVAGPVACAAALACGPSAIGIPAAMALLVVLLPWHAPGGKRTAWIGIAIAGMLAAAYALVLVYQGPAGAESAEVAGYADALAASCTRFIRYLGFWLVPVTAWMAADMPEAHISAGSAWPGWLGIVLVTGVLAAVVLARRGPVLTRIAATGLGCALALYSGQLLWPRLGDPFDMAASYAWMPCVCLVIACAVARLPLRAVAPAACVLVLSWLVLGANTLQTFSSHAALWDDAVRRAEALGPHPEDARIYLNRATLQRHAGHTIAALADYDQALQLQPDLVRALRGRAQLHISEGRYGDALRDLDRVVALEPGQAISHADRGVALMQAGRLAEAGRAFDTAIERGANEPRVYLNRGLTRFGMGGLSAAPAALADIERALALDADYALAYFNRALIFEQAARAGVRLRDAASPELMRAVAKQNFGRACQLGHQGACDREKAQSGDAVPGTPQAPLQLSPESLRRQGIPLQ